MDNLIKMLGIENPHSLDRESYPSNFDWIEGCGLNSAFYNGVETALKALIKWLYSACPHGIGDFHDKDKAVTMSFRIDCPECRKDLERIIYG